MSSTPPSPPSRIPRRKHSLVVTAPPRPETTEVPTSRGCLSLPSSTTASPYPSPRRHPPPSHSRKSSNSTSIRSIPSGTRPSLPSHASTNPNSPTPSTSTATFPRSHSPVRHPSTPSRPKLASVSSDVYTTFDLRPPNSPGEADDHDHDGWPTKLRTWLRGPPIADDEAGRGAASAKHGERQPLLPESSSVAEREREQDGLPRVTRECLVAEIKFYGFYILPPIIVFVVLALGISLWVYHTSLFLP